MQQETLQKGLRASLIVVYRLMQVKHILICGHYNCGAVKGALTLPAKEKGLVNLWISDIRDVRNRHEGVLKGIEDFQAKWDRYACMQ